MSRLLGKPCNLFFILIGMSSRRCHVNFFSLRKERVAILPSSYSLPRNPLNALAKCLPAGERLGHLCAPKYSACVRQQVLMHTFTVPLHHLLIYCKSAPSGLLSTIMLIGMERSRELVPRPAYYLRHKYNLCQTMFFSSAPYSLFAQRNTQKMQF